MGSGWRTPGGLSRRETPVTWSGIVPTFYRWLHLLRSRFILPPRTLPRSIILPLTRRSFDKIPIVREGYRTAHTEPPQLARSPPYSSVRLNKCSLSSTILFFLFFFLWFLLFFVWLYLFCFARKNYGFLFFNFCTITDLRLKLMMYECFWLIINKI